ncbi:MAG: archease, partial [Proteobacteria bacterium]|nr:archease [Pseudomonadota bacterium]
MPYTYLEEIAIADVAFRAKGKTEEEVFAAAADATVNVMVEDLAAIRDQMRMPVELENDSLDLLLFDFLNEFVYLKDAKGLLMRVGAIRVGRQGSRFTLQGELYGEKLDPLRHPLAGDV